MGLPFASRFTTIVLNTCSKGHTQQTSGLDSTKFLRRELVGSVGDFFCIQHAGDVVRGHMIDFQMLFLCNTDY